VSDYNTRLTGPDFLDAVAEVELQQGNDVNADAFRQRAREWRQLQADYDVIDRRNHSLQDALDRARAAVAIPA
jgi:hypothetical protein